jgi:hypothetical protein
MIIIHWFVHFIGTSFSDLSLTLPAQDDLGEAYAKTFVRSESNRMQAGRFCTQLRLINQINLNFAGDRMATFF